MLVLIGRIPFGWLVLLAPATATPYLAAVAIRVSLGWNYFSDNVRDDVCLVLVFDESRSNKQRAVSKSTFHSTSARPGRFLDCIVRFSSLLL